MANNTTKDMTSGSTMKLILGFAVPLLMGMLFQQAVRQTDLFRTRGIGLQSERRGRDIVVDLDGTPEQHRGGCTGSEHHKNPAGGTKLGFFVA